MAILKGFSVVLGLTFNGVLHLQPLTLINASVCLHKERWIYDDLSVVSELSQRKLH